MTLTPRFDVTAIGNAVVDVLANMDDNFLLENDMPKGVMTLVDATLADKIYLKIASTGVLCSGGSAANTSVGIAAMGGTPAFIGKVARDDLGDVFRKDIQSFGVHFTTPCLKDEKPTARCMVVVTPDAQRTMNTYLGACSKLSRQDIDEDLIKDSKIVYIEGYLWDRPEAKDALTYAVELAHKHKRKVSLSLSDAFCVNRHRESFLTLVKEGVDILFCNEEEMLSFFKTSDPEEAFKQAKEICPLMVITRGAKGAVAIQGEKRFEIAAEPIQAVVDTTGAGDLFAAGFLTGYTREQDIEECLQMGAIAAAEVISHYGARPEKSLKEIFSKRTQCA